MDSLHQDASLPSDDLSALAWVHEELRKSLDAAHKALHRCLKEAGSTDASDMDVLDPSILRSARQQIHQGVGALEMAGLPAGATLLRASEAVVQKFVNRPQSLSEDAVRDVEKASFALLDYIGRRLAGKAVPALALFPQYEALMARAGGALPRPTDLWSQDFPGGSLEAPLAPPEGIAPRAADGATVDDFEKGLLALLRRNQPADAVALADLCASLASGASQRAAHRESATWMLASGFLEGVAGAHVPLSVHAKRVLSSLLKQLRELVKGEGVPSDRLANELLFFCAQAGVAPPSEHSVLARVRRTFGLEKHQPVDLVASPLGRFDPAWIAQATKRVAGAKDGWSAVAGGELLRLGGLNEQFSLVADSLRRLFPEGPVLAEALAEAVARTVGSAQAPEPSLAMEVATSLLYLDASLEDGDFDHPDQAARVRRLAERIAHVGQGQPAEPLEAWMEDLYRRVSDRQTIGSVVQELRATLGECEKHIDAFFRAPQDRDPLVNVPTELQSMKGVLAVLGLDKAAHAVVHMREDVDHLLQPDTDLDAAAQAGVFDRLASNLGALGFLIDMMGVQPQLAKSLFTLDEATGVLAPVMGREKKAPLSATDDPVEAVAQHVQQVQREEAVAAAEELGETLARADAPLSDLSEQLQKLAETPHVQEQADLAGELAAAQAALDQAQEQDDEAALSAAREQVAQLVSDIAQPEPAPEAEPEVVFPPQAPLAPTPLVAPQATGLEEDDEMRDIFLEEAREVLADAQAAIAELHQRPDDVAAITGVRRAFHTLKGSSRMVGLGEYGEAAWACEQLYNTWMASQAPASADLLGLTTELLQHFAGWTEAIATRQDARFAAAPVVAAADAFRLHGERLSLQGFDEVPDVSAQPAPSEWADTAPLLSEVFVPEATPPEGEASFPTVDEPLSLDAGLSWATDEVVEQALAKLAREAEAEAARLPDPAPDAQSGDVTQAEGLADDALPPLTEPMLDAVMLDDQPSDVDLLAGQTESPPFVDSVTDAERIVLDLAEGDAPQTLSDAVSLDLGGLADSAPAAPQVDEQPELVPLPDLSLHEPTEVHGLDDEAMPTQRGELEVAPAELPAEAMDLALDLDDAGLTEASDAPHTIDPTERDEQVKVVGPLRISIPLFNIFLNEADEQSRRLCTTLNEWALELHRPVGDDTIALAHSLAGNSAAVGYTELSQLARLLEHALMRSQALGGGEADAAALFNEAADEIRRLLHQFAAGFLKSPDAQLLTRLADYDHEASRRLEARSLVGDFSDQPEGLGGLRRHLRLVHSADEPLDPVEPTAELGVDVDLDLTVAAEPVLAHTPEASDPLDVTSPAPLGVPEFKPLAELPDPVEVLRGAPGIQPANLHIDWGHEADIDAVDAIDADLFPIFEEEAQELLPQLATETRHWLAQPAHTEAATACMRTLHTFKGGARLAGAMRLGEMAHRMESAIERLLGNPQRQADDVAPLEGRVDRLIEVFEQLRQQDAHQQDALAHTPLPPADLPVSSPAWQASTALDGAALQLAPEAAASPKFAADDSPLRAQPGEALATSAPIDWASLPQAGHMPTLRTDREASGPAQAAVRVRPQLLDRLVNHAGEVSITRTRLQSQVGQIRGSLTDLTDNLDRLRQQLRDIELQAETQVNTRMEAARAASQNFDPLEFDRYTRFQELTRMMAESVNDVATVQRTLQRNLETAEDQLAAQARLTRDLQDDLLRTRMVEFEGLSDRLYRVVRQAAKETGKQVRLDIVGGATEIDRGVLERMTGAFEHLLRNGITHGIETPEQRLAAGKDANGLITVSLRQEGNEVSIEFRDDGAGLDLLRIRDKAKAQGLLAWDAEASDADLAQLIFTPGFSTAEVVTELAGRGIGMDVVRSEVNAMGGRIETGTTFGQGTSFRLVLPLTTAVTKVVMLRCGGLNVAVPTHLIEIVRRAKPQEVEQAYRQGSFAFGEAVLPFYWLGALLDASPRGTEGGRSLPVVIVRSAQQRIALHVDEVLGNQEVVVKNLGPQLSRLPGLAGMTLLASGAVSLIYNPVALATVYGDRALALTGEALAALGDQPSGWLSHSAEAHLARPVEASAESQAPMVLVVDDSLTVRKVTQRLLSREGYRVVLAKDGLEALERLAQERPTVVLSDIEMPRMDGFDLVRNIRADQKLADLPIIMITSRIAQKHRDYAAELGVNHYLGKPYGEEELLALVARYASLQVSPL